MSEISESIYFRSDDRSVGVEWLESNELAGYVLKPRAGWVQVFPDWAHLARNGKSAQALQNSSGLLVYYYYADERLWSVCIHRDGDTWFQHECIWMVDEYAVDGASVDEVADLFDISTDDLEPVLYTGPAGVSWSKMADNAADFADLVGLPNYAFASFAYADEDADETGLKKFLVGPDVGYDIEIEDQSDEPPDDDDQDDDQPVDDPPRRRPDPSAAEDAPWQQVYELANQFLQQLDDQELIELTLDSQLARDRLVERMTKTIIENPVSRDSQVLQHWLDNLMTAPEIVDVFATDDMLADAYQRAKDDVQRPAG